MAIVYYYEKIGLACALLVASMVCTMIPWVIHSKMKKKGFLVISLLTCLAAGVIVGAFFMHLLPEIVEGHDHSHSHDAHTHSHSHHGHDHSHSHDAHNHDSNYDEDTIEHDDDCDHSYPWGALSSCLSFFILLGLDRIFTTHQHGGQGCTISDPNKKEIILNDLIEKTCLTPENTCSIPINDIQEKESTDDCNSCHSSMVVGACHMDGLNQESSKSQAFVFVLVLSIHSFLEGLAAGPVSGQYRMLAFSICLVFHKLLESFALGVSVFKAKFSMKLSLVLNGVYSILTPLAMILSMIAINTKPDPVLLQVLNGLASGSFLFVGLMEMVAPEFHRKDKYTKYKFLLLMIGVACMAGLAALHGHHH